MSKKFYMSNRNLVWENLFLFKIRPTLYGRVDYFEAFKGGFLKYSRSSSVSWSIKGFFNLNR